MGRYSLETRLGAGGMAEVFKARQLGAEGFSRPVALKRVAPTLSHDAEFARLFIAEARIAALLQHPNIVAVHDFDRDPDGCLFLAMELIDGADLRRLVMLAHERGERLPPELAAYVVAEVLRALAYAHEFRVGDRPLGLVHRDVSPHNVLISRAGAVKLADFGIAKATAATGAALSKAIKGKVSYMAPEQARGQSVDGRADLFAVGIMLYELLAGERPFEGASEAEILAKLLTGRCAPLTECAPSTPAELVAIVERLMAPEAEARFASASDARQALAAWPGYPADGADVLAVWVARTLAGRDSEAPIAPTQPPPLAAGTPQPETRATRTRYRPSMRTLVVLSVLAALSVTAAITVWVVPIGGKHPAAPAGPPAQVERASALPPPPPAPTTPAGPAAAPSSATPVPRAAASPPAVPPPSPPGVDAGPAPSDDPPRKRGKAWEIERGAESPDVVPR